MVIGAVERGGNVKLKAIPNTDIANMLSNSWLLILLGIASLLNF